MPYAFRFYGKHARSEPAGVYVSQIFDVHVNGRPATFDFIYRKGRASP